MFNVMGARFPLVPVCASSSLIASVQISFDHNAFYRKKKE